MHLRLLLLLLFCHPQWNHSFLKYSYQGSLFTVKEKRSKPILCEGYDHRPYTEEDIENDIRQLIRIKKYIQQKTLLTQLQNDRINSHTKLRSIRGERHLFPLHSASFTPNLYAGGLSEDWSDLL
jgi:hypothetical protein